MKRTITTSLLNWKQDPDRRVLLLRGARQVGKTYVIRELAKTFEHYVEINFEDHRKIHPFFADDMDIETICRNLALFFKTPITDGKTLLFLDEIQACPDAIRALRFFYEKRPGLHVVAAGSLLEFALKDLPSFGVGRISSLYMHPISFKEFLWALQEEALWEEIANAAPDNPLHSVFHDRLNGLMKTHQIIGGMPAVVRSYQTHHDFLKCQDILDDLLRTFRDDFAKYAERVPVITLIETFSSVAFQAGGKFMFARAAQNTSIGSYKNALSLLEQAGLVHKVYHSSARGIPLAAQIDERKFKAFLLDTGIHQRLLGLDLGAFLTGDPVHTANEGSIAEVYAGNALIAGMSARNSAMLYYWHREARSSNAEVDYLITKGSDVVPVEVKAGTRGAMRSMHMFIDEGHAKRGIRLSRENFSKGDSFDAIPLYAAETIPTR